MDKIRIILFGTGALAKFLSGHLRENVEIAAYAASLPLERQNAGAPLISLDQIKDMDYDFAVVAFGDSAKGVDILKKAGVPEEKIVGYAYIGIPYRDNIIQKKCDRIAREMTHSEKITELFDIPEKKYYMCAMNVPEHVAIIERDFVREQTLSFLAEEINRKNVVGSVAEIGVSGGEFGRTINALFPDRRLYLFDTYSGLNESDKRKSIEYGWGEKMYALGEKGTPPEQVLEMMPHAEKCIIKKGYFPETFDIEGELAFVSLDIDFYDTTRRGLELIYPKLSRGGYIMVHDFNNLMYGESREAVLDFCSEQCVPYVPIADVGGSVVIAK